MAIDEQPSLKLVKTTELAPVVTVPETIANVNYVPVHREMTTMTPDSEIDDSDSDSGLVCSIEGCYYPHIRVEPELEIIYPEIAYVEPEQPIICEGPPEPEVYVYEPTLEIVELAAVATQEAEEPTTVQPNSVYGYGALAIGIAATVVYLYKRHNEAKTRAQMEEDEEDFLR